MHNPEVMGTLLEVDECPRLLDPIGRIMIVASDSTVLEHVPVETPTVSHHVETDCGTPTIHRDSGLQEVVYSAHGHLGLGLAAWREMAQELIASRELTWRLFLRD